MDVVDFASKLYKYLSDREQDLTDTLAAGSVKDWPDYQRLVGEIRGVAHCRAELKTLLEATTGDDEPISAGARR
jgi:hypothetical protein